jgi:prepilin-type N-terminal cleavage/methylation domain-containing protein
MTPSPHRGFTLVEIMVVVTLIGIISLISTPGIMKAANRAKATIAANDIRVFADAIEFYSSEKGAYPQGMIEHDDLPESVDGYLPSNWTNGTYSWRYRSINEFTFLVLYNLDFDWQQKRHIDSILDNGNIGTGRLFSALGGTGLIYVFRGG